MAPDIQDTGNIKKKILLAHQKWFIAVVRKQETNDHEFRAPCTPYTVSKHRSASSRGSLVDRGANDGIAGSDLRIIAKTDRQVDINGIDDHQLTNLPIVTAGGVTSTQQGGVIVVLHQYAYMPFGKTIHSSLQLESFKSIVDDHSVKAGNGTQTIKTMEGYVIPLDFVNRLPYMKIRLFNDNEWDSLPHVLPDGI